MVIIERDVLVRHRHIGVGREYMGGWLVPDAAAATRCTCEPSNRPTISSYYESAIGLSKGLVMLVLLPLVYRCLLKHGQKPNDYLFATVGIALGMGARVPASEPPHPTH